MTFSPDSPGVEGFRSFSHARAVYRQTRGDFTRIARPPYGPAIRKLIASALKK
jgi:coniferyl-aldehyde dehydrogenase